MYSIDLVFALYSIHLHLCVIGNTSLGFIPSFNADIQISGLMSQTRSSYLLERVRMRLMSCGRSWHLWMELVQRCTRRFKINVMTNIAPVLFQKWPGGCFTGHLEWRELRWADLQVGARWLVIFCISHFLYYDSISEYFIYIPKPISIFSQ